MGIRATGNTPRLLYLHIVRSLLEYCSPVWSPHQQYLSDSIERVQKNFIRYLCFISGRPHSEHTYLEHCTHFNLPTLHHRRLQTDIRTLHRITHHSINCPSLTSSLHFNIPRPGSRHPLIFRTPTPRTNLRKFAPLPRMMTTFNALFNSNPDLDIFSSTIPNIHPRNTTALP